MYLEERLDRMEVTLTEIQHALAAIIELLAEDEEPNETLDGKPVPKVTHQETL